MKIYTKTGDAGDTGLFGGGRVSKSSMRVWAYGEVDELNSVIGLCAITPIDEERSALLAEIQRQLFEIGGELATTDARQQKGGLPQISEDDVVALERAIDQAEEELEPLMNFVLPGGSELSARLHLARTVCRRAERRVVALAAEENVRGELVRYLNRLSDLLFTLARLANVRANVPDVPWVPRKGNAAE